MNKNDFMTNARKNKKDEFFTQYHDIERELINYKFELKNKTIYCNCDNPKFSQFYQFFKDKIVEYDIKKVVFTYYDKNGSIKTEIVKDEADTRGYYITTSPLDGDGDFRSEECANLLMQSDIVITNPPFSLFREYIGQLFKYEKKFLIIGHQNAITYKDVFSHIKNNELWLGYGFPGMAGYFINRCYEDYAVAGAHFDGLIRVSGVVWFTNIDVGQRPAPLILTEKYSEEKYRKFDNYDAINVGKIKEIPCDYDGKMGVPITFAGKYCPKQFEILDMDVWMEDNPRPGKRFVLDKKETYARIIIKHR